MYIYICIITMKLLISFFQTRINQEKKHKCPTKAKETTSGGAAVPKGSGFNARLQSLPSSPQSLPSYHLCGKELWTPWFLPWSRGVSCLGVSNLQLSTGCNCCSLKITPGQRTLVATLAKTFPVLARGETPRFCFLTWFSPFGLHHRDSESKDVESHETSWIICMSVCHKSM